MYVENMRLYLYFVIITALRSGYEYDTLSLLLSTAGRRELHTSCCLQKILSLWRCNMDLRNWFSILHKYFHKWRETNIYKAQCKKHLYMGFEKAHKPQHPHRCLEYTVTVMLCFAHIVCSYFNCVHPSALWTHGILGIIWPFMWRTGAETSPSLCLAGDYMQCYARMQYLLYHLFIKNV